VSAAGFVYFDERGAIIQANAITLVPQPPVSLYLDGPHAVDQRAMGPLEGTGRMRGVTISSLKEIGLETFGWVNPKERPGGAHLAEEASTTWPDGAFVYSCACLLRPPIESMLSSSHGMCGALHLVYACRLPELQRARGRAHRG
jgi:hypothetical protein